MLEEGVPALTVGQPEEGMSVLPAQAIQRKVGIFLCGNRCRLIRRAQMPGLVVVPVLPHLSSVKLGMLDHLLFSTRVSLNLMQQLNKGLSGNHQRQNASVAVQIAQTFLHIRAPIELDTLPLSAYIEGLGNAEWPGRCQTVVDPNRAGTTWFLDGAHTVESINCCVEWFLTVFQS